MSLPITIAIDGPAAAGKSTVAKKIAKKLNYIYVDTGAMYRALTLKALNNQIDIHNAVQLSDLLLNTQIELENNCDQQIVLLDGVDVTLDVRSEQVSSNVSAVATHKDIREMMVKRQQSLAENKSVVMDGRDIGTHVLPNATCKFFLLASVKERAKRRHHENIHKGFDSSLSNIIKQIERRDLIDSERAVAPLVKAKDAIEIDTTSLTIEQVVDQMMDKIKTYL